MIPKLLEETNHGMRRILAMPKPSGPILHLSEGISLPVVVGVLRMLKISLPVRKYV